MKVNMHRAKALPSSLNSTHDGLWYVKPDGNHPFTIYMVKDGTAYALVGLPQDLQGVTDQGNITSKEVRSGVLNNYGYISKDGVGVIEQAIEAYLGTSGLYYDSASSTLELIGFPKDTSLVKPYFVLSVNGAVADTTGNIEIEVPETKVNKSPFESLSTSLSLPYTTVVPSLGSMTPADMVSGSSYTGVTYGEMNGQGVNGTFEIRVGTTYKRIGYQIDSLSNAAYKFKLEYSFDFSSDRIHIMGHLSIWRQGESPVVFSIDTGSSTLINTGASQALDIRNSSVISGTMNTYQTLIRKN